MEADISSSSSSVPTCKPRKTAAAKHKDRHIVSWNPQEDDILRHQVRIQGTDNWTLISSKFKDKTSRQCRRRWFTYLNTEVRKGGWSPEEDDLLCEAQKVFGNRWTEIAKVVSGRTDNAVKNRFNTLSKKRGNKSLQAVDEDNPSFDSAKKRVATQSPSNTAKALNLPGKKIRGCASNLKENHGKDGGADLHRGKENGQSRSPLAMIAQNIKNSVTLPAKHSNYHFMGDFLDDDPRQKTQKIFLIKDDPKHMALMREPKLLSSLAQKVNNDKSEQNFEDSLKELQDYLVQNRGGRLPNNEASDIDVLPYDFKDLIDGFSSQLDNGPSLRPMDLHMRFHSTPCQITGGSSPSNFVVHKTEHQGEKCSALPAHENKYAAQDKKYDTTSTDVFLPTEGVKGSCDSSSSQPDPGFSSPQQTVPLFRSFADMIPTPKFSESERQFLLGLLALSPSSSKSNSNNSQNPSCKKVDCCLLKESCSIPPDFLSKGSF